MRALSALGRVSASVCASVLLSIASGPPVLSPLRQLARQMRRSHSSACTPLHATLRHVTTPVLRCESLIELAAGKALASKQSPQRGLNASQRLVGHANHASPTPTAAAEAGASMPKQSTAVAASSGGLLEPALGIESGNSILRRWCHSSLDAGRSGPTGLQHSTLAQVAHRSNSPV